MTSLNGTSNLYGAPVTPDACISFCPTDEDCPGKCFFNCCLYW